MNVLLIKQQKTSVVSTPQLIKSPGEKLVHDRQLRFGSIFKCQQFSRLTDFNHSLGWYTDQLLIMPWCLHLWLVRLQMLSGFAHESIQFKGSRENLYWKTNCEHYQSIALYIVQFRSSLHSIKWLFDILQTYNLQTDCGPEQHVIAERGITPFKAQTRFKLVLKMQCVPF